MINCIHFFLDSVILLKRIEARLNLVPALRDSTHKSTGKKNCLKLQIHTPILV